MPSEILSKILPCNLSEIPVANPLEKYKFRTISKITLRILLETLPKIPFFFFRELLKEFLPTTLSEIL